jgi:hypothetical protein
MNSVLHRGIGILLWPLCADTPTGCAFSPNPISARARRKWRIPIRNWDSVASVLSSYHIRKPPCPPESCRRRKPAIRNPSRWIGTIGDIAGLLPDAPVDCAFVPHADCLIIDSNFCQALLANPITRPRRAHRAPRPLWRQSVAVALFFPDKTWPAGAPAMTCEGACAPRTRT